MIPIFQKVEKSPVLHAINNHMPLAITWPLVRATKDLQPETPSPFTPTLTEVSIFRSPIDPTVQSHISGMEEPKLEEKWLDPQ